MRFLNKTDLSEYETIDLTRKIQVDMCLNKIPYSIHWSSALQVSHLNWRILNGVTLLRFATSDTNSDEIFK